MAITPTDSSPINRLIIVGNGFDLAHGLPTSYKSFIDTLWNLIFEEFCIQFKAKEITSSYKIHINDVLILSFNFSPLYTLKDSIRTIEHLEIKTQVEELIVLNESGFNKMQKIFKVHSKNASLHKIPNIEFDFDFDNSFLNVISKKSECSWIDIENEYYRMLEEKVNSATMVKRLNDEFEALKNILIWYINNNVNNKYEDFSYPFTQLLFEKTEIQENEFARQFLNEIAMRKKEEVVSIKVVNFNYTKTINRYINDYNIIQIHGSASENKSNPVIFGFGDEITSSYSKLENLDNNIYLKHIKSFQYSQTPNYKNLLDFIDLNNFQVYLLGHSCGLSDRVLLNTIFEHKNCISIKVYYHKDEKGNDNFNDITMNISRHFKDKARMRKVLVNKTYCSPLPQVELKRIS